MKLKLAAILALFLLPSFAMADWHGRGGGYHGGYGYRGYDRGWHHGGGRSFFDFSLGFGGYSGGYYPAYSYETYSPPVVYSAPAPVTSYGDYSYYGGTYYSAPVVVAPPVVTRTYVAPPVYYGRSYYRDYCAPSYNFSARYYYRH